jgi:hypothetical protein
MVKGSNLEKYLNGHFYNRSIIWSHSHKNLYYFLFLSFINYVYVAKCREKILMLSYAMFESWVLKGKGGEGNIWEEVNPCLRVLKQ